MYTVSFQFLLSLLSILTYYLTHHEPSPLLSCKITTTEFEPVANAMSKGIYQIFGDSLHIPILFQICAVLDS